MKTLSTYLFAFVVIAAMTSCTDDDRVNSVLGPMRDEVVATKAELERERGLRERAESELRELREKYEGILLDRGADGGTGPEVSTSEITRALRSELDGLFKDQTKAIQEEIRNSASENRGVLLSRLEKRVAEAVETAETRTEPVEIAEVEVEEPTPADETLSSPKPAKAQGSGRGTRSSPLQFAFPREETTPPEADADRKAKSNPNQSRGAGSRDNPLQFSFPE